VFQNVQRSILLFLLALSFIGCGDRRGAAAADASAPTQAPALPATQPAPSLTIAFVGDLMFARDVVDLMQARGIEYPFERVRGLLEGVDLLVGNFEGTFTSRGAPLEKKYTFRAPPVLAASLASAGFDAVTLGNNHAYDFGAVGLRDTLEALRSAGVRWVGAGPDETSARTPLVLRAPAGSVAILSYSAVGESVFASGHGAGVARGAVASLQQDVQRARALADFVAVVMHAGDEYRAEPNDLQRDLAHAAVDAGASIVVGHHPHVLQHWEQYGYGVIAYSLGNFVFDLDHDDLATLGSAPFETVVAVFTLRRDVPAQLEARPAYIDPDENRPRPATPAESARVRTALTK
jgi:poly-gamma-glutamate capsule biosynthesis protein CapA/YwtB (metallophosphatase superfamily)